MKLLIAGSRSITDFDLAPHIPAETSLIITGGAMGVDMLAEQYADAHKLSKLVLRPNYRHYGRCAPLRRNREMIEIADCILIVWDTRSRGTAYTIKCANELKKPLTVLEICDKSESAVG